MKRPFVLLVMLVVVGLLLGRVPASAAQDPLAPLGDGWTCEKKGEGVRIYYQDVPGQDVPKVQMVGIVDVPPEKVFRVVTDYAHFEDFMPYVEVSHVVHTETVDKNTAVSYVFFFVNPPLIAGRYYSLKLTDESDVPIEGTAGSYRSTWDLVTSGVYHETPESPGISSLVHNKNAVETRSNQGFWLLQPLDGGQKTRVVYQVLTDPGGSVPHWVADKAQMKTLPDLLETVRKQALK